MSDELIAAAEKHLAHDHERDEMLAAAQAYLEAAATNPGDVDPHVLIADLQKIVGVPL